VAGVLQAAHRHQPRALALGVVGAVAHGKHVGVGGAPADAGDVLAPRLALELPQREEGALRGPDRQKGTGWGMGGVG
jgi:hypothetical protein